MDNATIEKRAASQAINKTISLVEEALKMKFPRVATPSESREIMIAELRDATAKREDVREYVTGWGSLVILKRAKKQPVWVEWVSGGLNVDDDGWVTTTPEFERAVDEVAEHLRNGRLVDWGGTGMRDEQIRRLILMLDKTYRKQNPSFRGTKWDVQPPASWEVFYVLGMDDVEDLHTVARALKAMNTGKRIIDITGSAPVDLTDAYLWVVTKIALGELRWAKDQA